MAGSFISGQINCWTGGIRVVLYYLRVFACVYPGVMMVFLLVYGGKEWLYILTFKKWRTGEIEMKLEDGGSIFNNLWVSDLTKTEDRCRLGLDQGKGIKVEV